MMDLEKFLETEPLTSGEQKNVHGILSILREGSGCRPPYNADSNRWIVPLGGKAIRTVGSLDELSHEGREGLMAENEGDIFFEQVFFYLLFI